MYLQSHLLFSDNTINSSLLLYFEIHVNSSIFGIKGHTTISCPHRVTTEYGVIPAPRKGTHNSLEYVFARQLRPHIPAVISLSLPPTPPGGVFTTLVYSFL